MMGGLSQQEMTGKNVGEGDGVGRAVCGLFYGGRH